MREQFCSGTLDGGLERLSRLFGASFPIEPDCGHLHVKGIPVCGTEVQGDRCWISQRMRLRLPTIRHLESETSVARYRKIRACCRHRVLGGGCCAALKSGEQCLGSLTKRDYPEDIAGFEHKFWMLSGWPRFTPQQWLYERRGGLALSLIAELE